MENSKEKENNSSWRASGNNIVQIKIAYTLQFFHLKMKTFRSLLQFDSLYKHMITEFEQ